jgi:hypothetical protein
MAEEVVNKIGDRLVLTIEKGVSRVLSHRGERVGIRGHSRGRAYEALTNVALCALMARLASMGGHRGKESLLDDSARYGHLAGGLGRMSGCWTVC